MSAESLCPTTKDPKVEIPAKCVLTTSEAGVYTVVCEEGGVFSLNPDLEDLPALAMTIPSREQNAADYLLRIDGIKGDVKP